MTRLRRLALAADLVAFFVVLMGSWTRINGAGLTCPDWPTCRGAVIPVLAGGTVWEWTHRALALSLLPLVVLICAAAWRQRGRSTALVTAGAVIAVLFLAQVALGAATVRFENSPVSVVLHWGTAMAVIAALTALAIVAGSLEGGAHPPRARSGASVVLAALTAALAFVTMCIGAYVSSSGAGLACLSIPGCAGNVVVYTPGQVAQMLHRIAAGMTFFAAAATVATVWTAPAPPRVRLWSGIGLLLVFFQVILGLLNVALRLPTDLREVHAANAALVFLAFVAATACAFLDAPATRAAAERP